MNRDKYGDYSGGCAHCGNYDPERWLEMNDDNEPICERCADLESEDERDVTIITDDPLTFSPSWGEISVLALGVFAFVVWMI